MVPATKRLWMLSLPKWRIICMPPMLDNIRPWNLPNFTWKAMPPHGGGQWDKRSGKTMATLGNYLRNVSKPSLFQGIPITSRGANSATLWMPQMITCVYIFPLVPYISSYHWSQGALYNYHRYSLYLLVGTSFLTLLSAKNLVSCKPKSHVVILQSG
jgi:hypothetical protein